VRVSGAELWRGRHAKVWAAGYCAPRAVGFGGTNASADRREGGPHGQTEHGTTSHSNALMTEGDLDIRAYGNTPSAEVVMRTLFRYACDYVVARRQARMCVSRHAAELLQSPAARNAVTRRQASIGN